MPTLTATRRRFMRLRVARVRILGSQGPRDHVLPVAIEPSRNASAAMTALTAATGPQLSIGRWKAASGGVRPAIASGSQWGLGGRTRPGLATTGRSGTPMAAPWRLPLGVVMVMGRPDCPWW